MFSYCFGFCITFDLAGITGIQYILDTVSQELLNDPQKRFIYVEMAFFTRWWNELHDSTRHLIKGLVSAGDTLCKAMLLCYFLTKFISRRTVFRQPGNLDPGRAIRVCSPRNSCSSCGI